MTKASSTWPGLTNHLEFEEVLSVSDLSNILHFGESQKVKEHVKMERVRALRFFGAVTRLTVNRSLYVRKQIQLVGNKIGERQSGVSARQVDVLNYFSSQSAWSFLFFE